MKYFEPGEILLSDFDGVFLDSQKEYLKVMKKETASHLWASYLNSIDWRVFLRKCNEVPNATETFLQLQKLGILKGFLMKIHSFYEGSEKKTFLREKGFTVPIHYVGPNDDKSSIYIPNSNVVLIDDKKENTSDWRKKGGRAIIYDPYCSEENINEVNDMSHLLL